MRLEAQLGKIIVHNHHAIYNLVKKGQNKQAHNNSIPRTNCDINVSNVGSVI